MRECFEKVHRGDHIIFEHPSSASSLGELCVFRSLLSVFRVEGPMCRWRLLSGESGFMRQPVSWLTNHPHLAQAFEQWRENTPGTEPDRHVQVNNGLASAPYPVELVETFPRVVREDLRGSEQLSNATAFAAGPSLHKDCLVEEMFSDDVCGGVLEAESPSQGHGCRRSQDSVHTLG